MGVESSRDAQLRRAGAYSRRAARFCPPPIGHFRRDDERPAPIHFRAHVSWAKGESGNKHRYDMLIGRASILDGS